MMTMLLVLASACLVSSFFEDLLPVIEKPASLLPGKLIDPLNIGKAIKENVPGAAPMARMMDQVIDTTGDVVNKTTEELISIPGQVVDSVNQTVTTMHNLSIIRAKTSKAIGFAAKHWIAIGAGIVFAVPLAILLIFLFTRLCCLYRSKPDPV